MQVLSDRDVRALPAAEAVAAVRGALIGFAKGELHSPPRTGAQLGGQRVLFGGGGRDGGPIGLRVSGTATSPLEHVTLSWAADGTLEAVIVGNELGARRTGSVCAVAADLLAEPGPLEVGIVGSGRNGWTQIWALSAVREIRELAIYSPTEENRKRFAKRSRTELGLKASAVDSARAAVEGKGLVILCTTATAPVIESAWVRDRAHVTSVGPKSTTVHEVPEQLLARVPYIVSDAPNELSSPVSDLAGLPRHSLGELLLGEPPSRGLSEVSLFLVSGLGVTDAAYAAAVAARA
jgi:alanine dehydrogenase